MVIRSKRGEVNTSILMYVILGVMLVIVVGYFMFSGQGVAEDVAKLVSAEKEVGYATICKNLYLGDVNAWCKNFENVGKEKAQVYVTCDYLVKKRSVTIEGSEEMEDRCIPTEVEARAELFCEETKNLDKKKAFVNGKKCSFWLTGVEDEEKVSCENSVVSPETTAWVGEGECTTGNKIENPSELSNYAGHEDDVCCIYSA